MSASCSELRHLLLVLALLGLTGCVTRAEDAASQGDIAWFARTLNEDPFSDLDPETFAEDAAQMIKTPIAFYGRVISDTGEPVQGAQVHITVFDHLVDPFEFPYFSFTNRTPLTTGNDGTFQVTKEYGAGMYVRVDLPGWAPVSGARKLYVYAEGLNRTEPLPTKASPEQFVFELRPPEAQLRPIHTGALRFEDDGVPLEVSLRELAPYGVEPGQGEALISCNRTIEDAEPDQRFDWWCELTIPGGGLQPFRIEMDQAPETGYEETGRLAYSAGDPEWDDRASRDLIVKFADGKYGFVRVSMHMDGDFYVAFDGHWNPTGATWLD